MNKAKSGSLKPEEYNTGTCAITNLGMFGGEWSFGFGSERGRAPHVPYLAALEARSPHPSLTFSSLHPVSSFEAILPAGMGSILAIGGTKPVVVAQPNGHFGVQKQMTVTITCDHRHIYGADAAEFLRDLGKLLEEDTDSIVF